MKYGVLYFRTQEAIGQLRQQSGREEGAGVMREMVTIKQGRLAHKGQMGQAP